MPEITEKSHVEEGTIFGYVSTDIVGSQCEFPICSVEEWVEMSVEDAEKAAKEALYESGVMEWGY